jgi:hypothetical protein
VQVVQVVQHLSIRHSTALPMAQILGLTHPPPSLQEAVAPELDMHMDRRRRISQMEALEEVVVVAQNMAVEA